MAATFIKNKSKIQAILERNLAIVVPKLYSVSLISDEDRDLALNSSVDGSTRAAILTNAVESKIVNYRTWWILVYVLLSSGIDADKSFFESLIVSESPELHGVQFTSYAVTQGGAGPSDSSALEDSAALSLPSTQERHLTFGDSSIERTDIKTRGLEENPGIDLPPLSRLSKASSKDEATGASPSTPSVATKLSESEPLLTQEESTKHTSVVEDDIEEIQSVWYNHAKKKYPGIKFSKNYTKQTVTYSGDIIKGEGVELQILGRAIERGKSIEFTVQGCIEGPFELPEDVSFASPVYVITPHYQFHREVTVLADLFIHLHTNEDCNELVFLTSPSKPTIDDDGPCWDFQISESKPQCSVRSRRVRIEVKQFCLFCFGIRRRGSMHAKKIRLRSVTIA